MRLDLYNNVGTPTILKAIGIEEDKIPRIRGVGIDDGKILIHTRTGGGNREQYDDIESYVSGDYGIDHNVEEIRKAFSDYEDYHWKTAIDTSPYENDWQLPYDFKYQFPETEEEWQAKEAELNDRIRQLQEVRKEVEATGAYTNEYLRRNEFYISDEDEEFDCTYANFWYRIPEALTEELLRLENKEAKAVLGDAEVAIPLMFGDKDAQKTAQERLDQVTTAASPDSSQAEGSQNAPVDAPKKEGTL